MCVDWKNSIIYKTGMAYKFLYQLSRFQSMNPKRKKFVQFSAILFRTKNVFYLTVQSKEELNTWLESFENEIDVIPLLCAFSYFLKHWPVCNFQT